MVENKVDVYIPYMGGLTGMLKGSKSKWIRMMAERSEKAFPVPFLDYNNIDHMSVKKENLKKKQKFMKVCSLSGVKFTIYCLILRITDVLSSRQVGMIFEELNFIETYKRGFGYRMATLTEPCYTTYFVMAIKKFWRYQEGRDFK